MPDQSDAECRIAGQKPRKRPAMRHSFVSKIGPTSRPNHRPPMPRVSWRDTSSGQLRRFSYEVSFALPLTLG